MAAVFLRTAALLASVCLGRGRARLRKVHSVTGQWRHGRRERISGTAIDTAHTPREKAPDLAYVAGPGGSQAVSQAGTDVPEDAEGDASATVGTFDGPAKGAARRRFSLNVV